MPVHRDEHNSAHNTVTAFGLIGIGEACASSVVPFGFVRFPFSVAELPQAAILPHSTSTRESEDCDRVRRGSAVQADSRHNERLSIANVAFEYFVSPGLAVSRQAQQTEPWSSRTGQVIADERASEGNSRTGCKVGEFALWVWVDGLVWTEGAVLQDMPTHARGCATFASHSWLRLGTAFIPDSHLTPGAHTLKIQLVRFEHPLWRVVVEATRLIEIISAPEKASVPLLAKVAWVQPPDEPVDMAELLFHAEARLQERWNPSVHRLCIFAEPHPSLSLHRLPPMLNVLPGVSTL